MKSIPGFTARIFFLFFVLIAAVTVSVRSGHGANPAYDITSPDGLTAAACFRIFAPAISHNSAIVQNGPPANPKYSAPMADFNGDGCADLAIGSPGKDNAGISESGVVVIVYGSIGNWGTGPAVRMIGQTDGGLDDRFGSAIGFGDFNADGYSDLAVGIPGKTVGAAYAGQVRVYYGSPDGINPFAYKIYDQGDLIGAPEAGDNFGASLTAGDFNGDSYDDLAVGVPNEDSSGFTDSGQVNIIFGSALGLSSVGNTQFKQSDFASGALGSFDRFGTALASGDFNMDGITDLAIGTPMENFSVTEDAGLVDIVYGSDTTFGDDTQRLYQGILGGNSDLGELFGFALTTGDFNSDGYADLAVGSPGEEINGQTQAGVVYVVYGFAAGLNAADVDQWHEGNLPGAPDQDDLFGSALIAADFNGDGYDELAIGIRGENPGGAGEDAGAVQVLVGSAAGLTAAGSAIWTQNSAGIAGTSEQGDKFGYAITAADYNGDGIRDLAVGVPFDFYELGGVVPDAGEVNVIFGSITGLTSSGNVRFYFSQVFIPGTTLAEDWFGLAIR